MSEEVKTKMCSHCHKVLPVTMFSKSAHSPDGYQYSCKACVAEMDKERRAKKLAAKQEAQFKSVQKPESDKIVLSDGKVLKKKETIEGTIISLSDFSNRALLEELKTRGYVWDNMWIKVNVDYDKI